MRGDYVDDGGGLTVIVGHYPPNDFGLYDMSGNVSEWTADTYDEVSDIYKWDFNPFFGYEAKDSDPETLKRKVIRGAHGKMLPIICVSPPVIMSIRIPPKATLVSEWYRIIWDVRKVATRPKPQGFIKRIKTKTTITKRIL